MMNINKISKIILRDAKHSNLLQINDCPPKIAAGFALGTFIGVSPFIGLQFIIAVFLSKIFKLNKAAAILGVLNSNWIKVLCIYPLNYKIGKTLLNSDSEKNNIFENIELSFQSLINAGESVFINTLIGGLISGLIISIVFYLIMLNVIKQLKRISEKKMYFS